MNKKEIRKLIASTYWDLKRDHEDMDDFAGVSYDVGYMVSLLISLGRKKTADKMYSYFLSNW
jgi:hypothetical protein